MATYPDLTLRHYSEADYFVIYDCDGISDHLYGATEETINAFANYLVSMGSGATIDQYYMNLEAELKTTLTLDEVEEVLDDLSGLVTLMPESELKHSQEGFKRQYWAAFKKGMLPFATIVVLDANRFALRLTGVK